MTTFVELHVLRSFPPSNLNRDDLGSPKTGVFGGTRRLRVSSQCLKRTWRMSEHFRGAFAEGDLGIRTDRLPEEVLRSVAGKLDATACDGLRLLLASIGKKDKKASAEVEGDDDAGDGARDATGETADVQETRTPHLLFLSRQEIETVGRFAEEHREALSKTLKKKRPDPEALKKLRKALTEYLETHTQKNAVDIGLFGRFVTSDEFDTVEGALQVAHGLGTQKVEVEYDYFTAVDDLSHEAGAGHLGESEFASSVLYLYACCDLDQLEENLGARGANGREPDEEARLLARRSLPALVRAMAEATPKGKRTGTAPHTPAEYVEVVVRNGAPLSFANAFVKPVEPREAGGDVMAASVVKLVEHRNRLERGYERGKDVIARFVLCLRDVGSAVPAGVAVETIGALGAGLTKALDGLPRRTA